MAAGWAVAVLCPILTYAAGVELLRHTTTPQHYQQQETYTEEFSTFLHQHSLKLVVHYKYA